MRAGVKELARTARALFWPDHVRHDGSVLPAPHLRYCGARFADDRAFVASAEAEAERLVRHLGLHAGSRILDVGCGVGRLAIGVLRRVGEITEYRGVDVSRRSIHWCQRHIARLHPRFQFDHLDIRNERYNPRGRSDARRVHLPFDPGRFDIIYLYSVFSHMRSAEVQAYLGEFRRLAAPAGRLFLTAFVEEGVEDEAVNPEGYRRAWEGPLHCVRFERGFLERLLAASGFRLDGLEPGTETDGQSALYVSPRPRSATASDTRSTVAPR